MSLSFRHLGDVLFMLQAVIHRNGLSMPGRIAAFPVQRCPTLSLGERSKGCSHGTPVPSSRTFCHSSSAEFQLPGDTGVLVVAAGAKWL